MVRRGKGEREQGKGGTLIVADTPATRQTRCLTSMLSNIGKISLTRLTIVWRRTVSVWCSSCMEIHDSNDTVVPAGVNTPVALVTAVNYPK